MIVTSLGTKGGTGTTTLAVNCAADLRRLTNRPTLIADVKAGPGDVAVFLGLRPRYSIVDVIDQLGWMDKALAVRFLVGTPAAFTCSPRPMILDGLPRATRTQSSTRCEPARRSTTTSWSMPAARCMHPRLPR